MMIPFRCTTNKLDEVKNTRSIGLNALIIVDGERIASGANLNINNLEIGAYNALCKELGVKEITDKTPITAELDVAVIKGNLVAWESAWNKADE